MKKKSVATQIKEWNRALDQQAYNRGKRQYPECLRGLIIANFQQWIDNTQEIWGVMVTITAEELWNAYQTGLAEYAETHSWGVPPEVKKATDVWPPEVREI
jgi:hypothetical protein